MKIKNYLGKYLTALTLFISPYFYNSTEILPLKAESSLEQKINAEQVIQTPQINNSEEEKYAILISGDDQRRDAKDLTEVYNVLCEIGFNDENIYIFDIFGAQETSKNSRDIQYSSYALANKENIRHLFCELSMKIDNNDLLFIYITDNGRKILNPYNNNQNKKEKWIYEIQLLGENLNNIELKKSLSHIDSKTTIVFADICHGGGFANAFSNENYVGISSAGEDELAETDAAHAMVTRVTVVNMNTKFLEELFIRVLPQFLLAKR